MEKFFVEWLKVHGEKWVEADDRGVGVAGNSLRLRAATYDVKKNPSGPVSVELEFRITLPSGAEIIEYLAGIGDTEEKAIGDCLTNFVLTTFHTVYKAFINSDDPHQVVQKITIAGRDREFIQGDLLARGEVDGGGEGLNAMTERIREVISKHPVAAGPHWLKVVYAQQKKQLMLVSVTLDNLEVPALAAQVKSLPWPAQETFYMAKQFLVIK